MRWVTCYHNERSVQVFSILILCLSLSNFSYPISLYAKECVGDYVLNTQAEIDNFDCTSVTGNLEIRDYSSDPIKNLDGLASLTSVGGDLTIDNTALTNIDGLAALTSVGAELMITSNEALTNIDGLAALTSVGEGQEGSFITYNVSLTKCCGLYPLLTVGTIEGDITIKENNTGCNSIEEILNAGPCCALNNRFEKTDIANGVRYYTDRNYCITFEVPYWMVGRMLIKTPNDERFNYSANGYIQFKTPVSWWVYVLFDSRAPDKPDWLDGWEFRSQYKIYTSLKTQPHFQVWRKYFNAGDCVDQGGNFGPGSSGENRSNYLVVYGKEGTSSCTLDPKFGETAVAVGANYYTDRGYTLTGGVPSWMIGRTLIQSPNDEKKNSADVGYIRFTNSVNWWVYVLFDSRSEFIPTWLKRWEFRTQYKIQTSLATQPYLKIYRKWFDAKQCVSLGGNYGPGSSGEYRSNYSVVYGK